MGSFYGKILWGGNDCGDLRADTVYRSYEAKSRNSDNLRAPGFAGAVGIYAVNGMLKSQGLEVVPGVNPVTVLTVGTLGISGFALIYAILFYRLL